MTGYYVHWYAEGTTYVEAQSKTDALEILEHDPTHYIDLGVEDVIAEYAREG